MHTYAKENFINLFYASKQVIRVKNSWGLPPHALESLAKHWSVSAQLNIH